jgi:hypothetical protein
MRTSIAMLGYAKTLHRPRNRLAPRLAAPHLHRRVRTHTPTTNPFGSATANDDAIASWLGAPQAPTDRVQMPEPPVLVPFPT